MPGASSPASSGPGDRDVVGVRQERPEALATGDLEGDDHRRRGRLRGRCRAAPAIAAGARADDQRDRDAERGGERKGVRTRDGRGPPHQP